MTRPNAPILWRHPAPETTAMHRFMDTVTAAAETAADPIPPEISTPAGISTYQELHHWSISHHETFWALWLARSGIVYLDDTAAGSTVQVHNGGPLYRQTWFPDVSLSVAANLLRPALSGDADTREALVAYRESEPPSPPTESLGRVGVGAGAGPPIQPSFAQPGPAQRITYGELLDAVLAVRERLAPLLSPGDSVAAVVPNGIEAVVTMLSAVSLGAVWSSASPDFGTEAVVDRFSQIEPKVLLGCSTYRYGGTLFDVRKRMESVLARLPSVVLALAITDGSESSLPVGFEDFNVRDSSWPRTRPAAWHSPEERRSQKAQLSPRRRSPQERRAALESFEQFSFDHPLYTMFSSGTTGAPKGIVHGGGGTLLQHTKEHILHSDLGERDRILYFTTCGWMMWNWLVSALFTGATVVLFDGSPVWPGAGRLWDIVQEEGLTHLGVSPRYLSGCRARGVDARSRTDSLRVLFSTGSPLLPEDFDYVYERIAPRVQLASISGGTDIISCFVLGVPTLPVRRGEIQAAGLGMDVIASDDHGQPLIGERGELICRTPFPSRPVGFLGDDPEQTRYRRAYFQRFPGWWTHGDYIEITGSVGEIGGIIVHGRSDTTLNPGGVRIGTAEIYRHVEALDAIADSLVVGHSVKGDVEMVLFVVPTPGVWVDHELRRCIRDTLREHASPRHVPKRIYAVTAVPYTRSGKKVELAVRDMLQGLDPKNVDALTDPAVLAEYGLIAAELNNGSFLDNT